jgi:hypothetical protein
MCSFILWVICGVFSAGLQNAYSRGHHSYIRESDKEGYFNLCHSIGFGILGPLLLPVVLIQTGFGYYGWNLKWRAETDG